MKKTKVKMNKPAYLGMSKHSCINFGMTTLNQSIEIEQNYVIRILIALLFIFLLKIFFQGIANDVERWFDTSNYDENNKRPLPIGKNKKEIVFFEYQLGGKIMVEICALRGKTWSNLMDDLSEHKKAKGTKKAIIKRRLMFKNCRDCLFNNTAILRLQQRFKNDCHEMYTEEVNKIVLSSDDGKRLSTYDRVKIYKQAD